MAVPATVRLRARRDRAGYSVSRQSLNRRHHDPSGNVDTPLQRLLATARRGVLCTARRLWGIRRPAPSLRQPDAVESGEWRQQVALHRVLQLRAESQPPRKVRPGGGCCAGVGRDWGG